MSESWDALMRRKNARLADDVRLVKLQVDRTGEHTRAVMEADRILDNREWDELYAFLREHFPGFKHEVRISTPRLAMSARAPESRRAVKLPPWPLAARET